MYKKASMSLWMVDKFLFFREMILICDKQNRFIVEGLLSLKNSIKILRTIHYLITYLVFTYCRCFGLLISHGRNVRHSDMNLVEMVRTSWHPTMHQFLPYKDMQDHLLTLNNALVASI